MKPTEVFSRLYLLQFPTQYMVTSTFMRLQEFYESPHEPIRNKHFTWEQFIDCYVRNGVLSYWHDWAGFNIPGNVYNQFFKIFGRELTEKEKKLQSCMKDVVKELGDNFYLIGVYSNADVKHEVAHGLYYLNEDYRKEVENLIKGYSKAYYTKLCTGLKLQGYCDQVLKDEIQAYAIDKRQPKFVELFRKYRKLET